MAQAVGGQAVIEGVMMLRGKRLAVAVRAPNKKIAVKKEKIKFWKPQIPFLRGLVALTEMLYIGTRALNWSADVAVQEEGKKKKKEEKGIGFLWIVLTIVLALGFALTLFKFIPLAITQLLDKAVDFRNVTFAFVDGAIKIVLLVGYIWIISLIPDIKQVFRYHGAEHKVVNCYEAGKALTVKNARKFSCLNPRCGTSFILIVLLLSIFVYCFIPKDFSFLSKLILRIAFLPVIAGIAYEALKISNRLKENPVVKILIKPGLWIQGLTTAKPSAAQIKVALVALKNVLR